MQKYALLNEMQYVENVKTMSDKGNINMYVSLQALYTGLKKEKWDYYGESIREVVDCLNNPEDFIKEYLKDGQKIFLWDEYAQKLKLMSNEGVNRLKHMVSTFFLGCCLKEIVLGDICSDSDIDEKLFIWLWFLLCFCHDKAYYIEKKINTEDENKIKVNLSSNCAILVEHGINEFCSGNEQFLYSKEVINEYYIAKKEGQLKKYDKKELDHGIIAGCMLADFFKKAYGKRELETNMLNGRHIDKNTIIRANKIAKIIACHNIFGRGRMPTNVNDIYDRIFILFAIVDTIEPIKKGIGLEECMINISEDKKTIYICIKEKSYESKQKSYYACIKNLNKWVNKIFAEVEINQNNPNVATITLKY